MGFAAMTKYSFQELAWSVGVPKVAREVLLQVPELIAKAVEDEREACARACEELEDRDNAYEWNVAVLDCASVIRARGDE